MSWGVVVLCLVGSSCWSRPGGTSPPETQALGASQLGGRPVRLRLLHFADFGDTTAQRDAVAGLVKRLTSQRAYDGVLMPGDNLYPCGPSTEVPGAQACRFEADGNTVDGGGPPDPLFDLLFHRPLAGLSSPDGGPLPVWLSLGNHDVGLSRGCGALGMPPDAATQRLKACLEVAHHGPSWNLPARHYALELGGARFVFFDSNVLSRPGGYGGFGLEDELAFLSKATSGCGEAGAGPCFLVSHHLPVTSGRHRPETDDDGYRERVARVEAAARFDAWFVGHDHDLQHLRAAKGYDVFVSGNGSRGERGDHQRVTRGGTLLFGSNEWGVATLELLQGGWSVRFEDVESRALYCCESVGRSACRSVSCTP